MAYNTQILSNVIYMHYHWSAVQYVSEYISWEWNTIGMLIVFWQNL